MNTQQSVQMHCNCSEIIESKCNEMCYNLDENKLPIRLHDGTIQLFSKEQGGLCYTDAPEHIRNEIKKIVKKHHKNENIHNGCNL